jgi:acetylglutamate synthase
MRKNKNMVSLNPEYGIEVTTLAQLADKVKNDNPELYNILTILIASMLGKDEKKLLDYCNKYLEDKVYSDKVKDQITKMLDEYKKHKNDSDDFDSWKF